jgi:PKD repeat protein
MTARYAGPTRVALLAAGRFTATLADPNGGHAVRWIWSMADGAAAQATASSTFTHVYTHVGTYRAKVVITDNFGAQSTATFVVTVAGRPITARYLGPTRTFTGDPDTYWVGRFHDGNKGGVPSLIRWHFSDGSAPRSGDVVDHLYKRTGVYHDYVTVTDQYGASITLKFTVKVTRPPAR